jgi:outer membrane lipoprotein-sorting protein
MLNKVKCRIAAKRVKFFFATAILTTAFFYTAAAQDATELIQKVKTKLEKVNDYEASGKMKTNVTFLKVPIATVKMYFKKPNKLKIKSDKGISFVPKGAVNINLNSVISGGKYTVLDAGTDKVNGTTVRVIKLLPEDDNAEVVLSTLYIDEANALIKKAKTTTRENGSYELEMTYNKYMEYGLPDKIIFSFNTKDYKLPKGVTFDFDDGQSKKIDDKAKNKKGRAEITISSYSINKGIADTIFQ